ncbi:MAG TPA: hypothetical protein VLW88_14095 [Hyphomicrobium sp.]|nr:hypothetical protein [Hyphomicrobium sp.]
MKVKRGRVLRGYKSIVCGALALGMAGCSSSVKLPMLGGPPEQHQGMDCDALNAEKARLLAERDDLNAPFFSSKTQAQREGELTQLNGKLYTVAKAQFDKQCPAVADGSAGSVVR